MDTLRKMSLPVKLSREIGIKDILPGIKFLSIKSASVKSLMYLSNLIYTRFIQISLFPVLYDGNEFSYSPAAARGLQT